MLRSDVNELMNEYDCNEDNQIHIIHDDTSSTHSSLHHFTPSYTSLSYAYIISIYRYVHVWSVQCMRYWREWYRFNEWMNENTKWLLVSNVTVDSSSLCIIIRNDVVICILISIAIIITIHLHSKTSTNEWLTRNAADWKKQTDLYIWRVIKANEQGQDTHWKRWMTERKEVTWW